MIKRKALRVIIITFSALLLIAFATQIFLSNYLEPIVKSKLEKAVLRGSDSLYRLELRKLDINVFTGGVKLDHLHLVMDSTRFNEMSEHHILPPNTFDVTIDKGAIKGFRVFSLLFKDEIHIREIVMSDASIKMCRQFIDQPDLKKDTSVVPLWKLLQPDLNGIYVKRFSMNNLKFSYLIADSTQALEFDFDSCYADVQDFVLDSLSAPDTSRMFFCKKLAFDFTQLNFQTADSMYSISTGALRYSSSASVLEIDRFDLHPMLDEQAYYERVAEQKDMYNIKIAALIFKNFSLTDWLNNNELIADTLTLVTPVIDVYNDRTAAPSAKSKLGKFPNQLIQKAPFGIHIRQIKSDDAKVSYGEKNAETKMVGTLIMNKICGTISNVTNDSLLLLIDSVCVADLHCIMMDRGGLKAAFQFQLKSKEGDFSAWCEVDNMDATQLNKLMVPLANTRLKSFDVGHLVFNMAGNELAGEGNLRMTYQNLDVELIDNSEDKKKNDDRGNDKKEKNKREDKAVGSWLLNKFALFPDNPMKDEEVRVVNYVLSNRDPYKSFFNLIWKTLFEGVNNIAVRDRVQLLPHDKK